MKSLTSLWAWCFWMYFQLILRQLGSFFFGLQLFAKLFGKMNQWQSCLANERSYDFKNSISNQYIASLRFEKSCLVPASLARPWQKWIFHSMWRLVRRSRFQPALSFLCCLITSSWSSASKKVDLGAHIYLSAGFFWRPGMFRKRFHQIQPYGLLIWSHKCKINPFKIHSKQWD